MLVHEASVHVVIVNAMRLLRRRRRVRAPDVAVRRIGEPKPVAECV
jgi:hypothetical protein